MTKYYKSFQGLRGYAILLIFFSHCTFCVNRYGMNISTKWGAFGVELFIMLSGYLLMSNYHDKNLDITRYIKKKIKKFYPLHILTLLVAVPFSLKLLLSIDIKTWLSLFCNITLTQAWIPKSSVYFGFNSVAWYLSLNVFLITISPFVLRFWKDKSKKEVLVILFSILIIEACICMFAYNSEYAHWLLYICPLVRSLDFLAGGGIYIMSQDNKNNAKFLGLGLGIAMPVLAISMFVPRENWWFSSTLWFIPASIIILGIGCDDHAKNNVCIFQNHVIQHIGSISFEFFLIHQLCIRYVAHFFQNTNTILTIFVNIVLSFTTVEILCFIKKRKKRLNHDI